MDETELDQLDESLRRVCHENDLSWVAESVDTAIRDRISESVNPGSSAYHRRGEVWAGGFSYDDDGSAQPNPQIVEREYGQQERILLLVDSILGVYRDLPDIETETLRVLNQGFDGRVPPTESIVWPSENDVGSPDIVLTNEPDIDQQQRLRVVDVLLRIRSEVLA